MGRVKRSISEVTLGVLESQRPLRLSPHPLAAIPMNELSSRAGSEFRIP
jgi:hypothetical protein